MTLGNKFILKILGAFNSGPLLHPISLLLSITVQQDATIRIQFSIFL